MSSTMTKLEAKQLSMRKRYARKPKARGLRAPKLERGITVRAVRRGKPVADFPELQALLCAHLRSPKIKAGDFHKLLEIGTRYGLVLPNIRPIPAEEAEAPNSQDLSPELREVLRMEKEMREQRKKEQETKKQ
jgi:hypothetical protein